MTIALMLLQNEMSKDNHKAHADGEGIARFLECLSQEKASTREFEQVLIPIGSIVVPFGGSYLESCKVIPKRNYYGALGYTCRIR